jgi:hypothetical protein
LFLFPVPAVVVDLVVEVVELGAILVSPEFSKVLKAP